MNDLTSSIIYSLFVERRDENWVFSPASYLSAMSDLALCIKDTNLAELIAKAPDINDSQTKGLESYNCLLYAQEYGPHILSSVAEALTARGNDLKPVTSPAELVSTVNAIVREKTRGKIDNLIRIEDIGPFLKFVILNCVYFKKDWYHKFDTRHYAEDFKGAKRTTQVRYLNRQVAGQCYYEDSVVDIVEVPYRGEKWEQSDIACYVIVPKTASLFEVFSDLKANLAKIADVKPGSVNNQTVELNLTVPPFKIESTIELKEPTKLAGVQNVFQPNQEWTLVDLPKLAPGSVMWVEWIKQKAYIDFTEKGTEAAAATAIGMFACSGCCGSPPPPPPVKYIRADKPFIYVLANKSQPDKPLFVGVVNDVPDSKTREEEATEISANPPIGTPSGHWYHPFFGWLPPTYQVSNENGLSGVLRCIPTSSNP